ncbi:hypothetical protein PIB30_106098 [Stylosanthes scabra]|uniref:Secreted protein n=1 Tax=Stylosanthes scabra TaxID=79078 RepID=A0ABU6V2L4_9FABA|nr:hypothetical protein [Stylosanthes scabra]
MVDAEMTSGWFMLLVVYLISSEEKTIAEGGFPARGLGMTSTARHECLLRFAAFLDGGFPSSGIPPEIITISRCVPRFLGSSFRLSVLGSRLFALARQNRGGLSILPCRAGVVCGICSMSVGFLYWCSLWVLEPTPFQPEIPHSRIGSGRR